MDFAQAVFVTLFRLVFQGFFELIFAQYSRFQRQVTHFRVHVGPFNTT